MQAVQMKDLEVGQWGLFDPIYGPEKVLAIDTYALGPDERGARVFGTSIKSGTWEAVRFYVTNERTEGVVGRYVLRFPTEPVIAMTFDRRPSEVDSRNGGSGGDLGALQAEGTGGESVRGL